MHNILILVVLFCLFATPVFAAEKGSLLLKNLESGAAVFRVADAQGFPTADFAGVTECLTAEDMKPAVAKKFYQRAIDKELAGQTDLPNEKKEIFFEGLEKGWYLVCSVGDKAEFAPFLIRIPMNIGDKTIYDIQAEPKVDNPPESTPSQPVNPDPEIPQTGAILWPKYLLLGLGAVLILAGIVEALRGREKEHE